MNDFNIGDKVYLECEVKEKDMSDNTYKLNYTACYGSEFTYIKDDVLHTSDESYNKGLNDAWELVKKIVKSPHEGGYKANELADIFGISDKPVLDAYTPQEALAKVRAYEEKHDEIKAGDVVKDSVGEALVLRIDDNRMYLLCRDRSCGEYNLSSRYKKTGKHFDSIDEFMRSTND